MSRENIINLLNEYYRTYQLATDLNFQRSASFIPTAAMLRSNLSGYRTYFGRLLNWLSQEHPDTYEDFKSRLFKEIDDEASQNKILDAEYTAMLDHFVPDLRLLIPQTLETLIDKDKMGTGDVLMDLLLRRNYGTQEAIEHNKTLAAPQSMNPIIVQEIVRRIPRMYELVLKLKGLRSHFRPDEAQPKHTWPNQPHPIKPQLEISYYSSLVTNEPQQYIENMLDLFQNIDIMAAVCKELVEEDPPGIWSQIIADFYGLDPSTPMVEFYTKQAIAEHIFMHEAKIMQPPEDSALANNAEIVQAKIRSSLNLARFIYNNYSHATTHLDVVATALTSTMTQGLSYYIDDQKIQEMDLEQVKELIKEKLKLPREKDAEFALFLKSFQVKPPASRLTNG